MTMARIEKRGCWGGRLVERAGRRYCCGMDMAGVMAMERVEQYRGTLRKPKIGISWRYTGEGLICLRPSPAKAKSRETRDKREEREEKKTPKENPPKENPPMVTKKSAPKDAFL